MKVCGYPGGTDTEADSVIVSPAAMEMVLLPSSSSIAAKASRKVPGPSFAPLVTGITAAWAMTPLNAKANTATLKTVPSTLCLIMIVLPYRKNLSFTPSLVQRNAIEENITPQLIAQYPFSDASAKFRGYGMDCTCTLSPISGQAGAGWFLPGRAIVEPSAGEFTYVFSGVFLQMQTGLWYRLWSVRAVRSSHFTGRTRTLDHVDAFRLTYVCHCRQGGEP